MSYRAESPEKRFLLLQAITPLHPGTGQSTGVVDLPVQREVHTRFPVYSASGLKGALRDKAERGGIESPTAIEALFGSEVGNQGQATTAGALVLTDARILAFPVRSLQKIFFWVTCPTVLDRLHRDMQLLGFSPGFQLGGEGPGEREAWIHPDTGIGDELVLEEIALAASTNEKLKEISEKIACLTDPADRFDPKRLALLTDDDFTYFVQYATQVSARIKLNERKTTSDDGNLWYEETLPPDTLMYALAFCYGSRIPRTRDEERGEESASAGDDALSAEKGNAKWTADQLRQLLADRFLQIGGNETVGQGWCRIICADSAPETGGARDGG